MKCEHRKFQTHRWSVWCQVAGLLWCRLCVGIVNLYMASSAVYTETRALGTTAIWMCPDRFV